MADTVGKMYFQGVAAYIPYALVILVLLLRPSGILGKVVKKV
jgi:branched-subunit amino acid ABC-type transport system permease component